MMLHSRHPGTYDRPLKRRDVAVHSIEQLQILRNGVALWNKWRADNPGLRPDLSEADLSNADLSNAVLSDADLSAADLSNADLSKADLIGANLFRANLMSADLWKADLSKADLSSADLSKAILSNAVLWSAKPTSADLTSADLGEADLSKADLSYADFRDARLNNAAFNSTIVNRHTLGLDGLLTNDQLDGLSNVESDTPSSTAQITVGAAKRILGPANEVLKELSIPNDLSEAHRDLFLGLCCSIEELQQRVAELEDDNRRLSEEDEVQEKLDEVL